MDWPTITLSVGTAVVVAYLGPQIQHRVWRKQKLREQRIDVAERFAKIGTSLSLMTHSMPTPSIAANPQVLEVSSLYLEQFALLVLVQILFTEPPTREAGTAFRTALDKAVPNMASIEHMQKLYSLRVQLLACLFAEAYGISTNKLANRANVHRP